MEICHRLTVDLDDLQRTGLLNQILGHHTHARTYLEHREFVKGFIDGIGNSLGDTQVGQEVLAEIFLGAYLFHGCKDTKKE